MKIMRFLSYLLGMYFEMLRQQEMQCRCDGWQNKNMHGCSLFQSDFLFYCAGNERRRRIRNCSFDSS